MLRKNLLLILAASCVLISLFSERYRKVETLGGNESQEAFERVSDDGWTEGEFSIRLAHRVGQISSIVLTLDSYRPPGAVPVNLTITNCPQSKMVVSSNIIEIQQAWNCAREIQFVADNTFRLPDGRRVAVKISNIRLDNGWNIFDGALVQTFVTLASISLLGFVAFLPALGGAFVTAVTTQAFLGFANAQRYWDSELEFAYLCIFLGSIFIGNMLLSLTKHKESAVAYEITQRTFIFALLFIVGAGFALRVYGLQFGLPNAFHPDETRKARIILRFVATGNYDPNYFLHPTLLLYLSAFTAKIGAMLGFFTEMKTPEAVLSGRIVSLIAGTASIILCALCAKIVGSRKSALIACGIVAFAPLTVTCSRYLKEDSLVLSMMLTSLLFCLLAANSEKRRYWFIALAGLFAGIAAGSKYSGLVCGIFIVSIPWLASKNLFPVRKLLLPVALAVVILIPLGFVMTTPYSVITPAKFTKDFNSERKHMQQGHDSVQILASKRYWLYHASHSLTEGIGFWVVILLGFLIAELLRTRSIKMLILLGFFLAFYLPAEYVKAKPEPQPERYVMPCVALLAILLSSSSLLRSRGRYETLAVGSLLLFPALLSSSKLAAEIYPDTRIIMKRFINEKIKPGRSILIDAASYSAPVSPRVYSVHFASSSNDRAALTPSWLEAKKIDYVLLTSHSWERYFSSRATNRLVRNRYRTIMHQLTIVKEVRPEYRPYAFHNPVLRLYRVKALPPS